MNLLVQLLPQSLIYLEAYLDLGNCKYITNFTTQDEALTRLFFHLHVVLTAQSLKDCYVVFPSLAAARNPPRQPNGQFTEGFSLSPRAERKNFRA